MNEADRDQRMIRGIVDALEERRSGGDRRQDSAFVGHVRAANEGIIMGRGWLEIVVMLIGFGISIGMMIANNRSVEKSFDDFKTEIRVAMKDVTKDATDASNEARDLRYRVDQLERAKTSDDGDNKARETRLAVLEAWKKTDDALRRR